MLVFSILPTFLSLSLSLSLGLYTLENNTLPPFITIFTILAIFLASSNPL